MSEYFHIKRNKYREGWIVESNQEIVNRYGDMIACKGGQWNYETYSQARSLFKEFMWMVSIGEWVLR